jgi:uncharacterized membrane protein YgdD (TMEM256/DUF423 family)
MNKPTNLVLMPQLFIRLGSLFSFLSVSLGAFGAHILKNHLTVERLDVFETAVLYMFLHGFALIGFGLFKHVFNLSKNWPGWFFVSGIILFSGSLFLLVLLDIPKLGMVTPLGGICFLIAWFGFFISPYLK